MSKEFNWTDEAVKEFVLTYNKIDKLISGTDPIMQTIKEFKQSKQPCSRDWEVVKVRIGRSGHIVDVGDTDDTASHYPIHSVKRLSDGEVFSVGDEVENGGVVRKIENFFISPNIDVLYAETNNNHAWRFMDLKKAEKPKPLFMDVKGNGVFVGDRFYSVTDDFEIIWSDAISGIHLTPQIISRSFRLSGDAEEYILLNKPLLSVNDVKKIANAARFHNRADRTEEDYWVLYESILAERVKQLAKDKLSGKE